MIPKIGEQGIVDILLSILNEKQANAGFIMEPLHLLAVLSGDSSICKTIASKGMHSICSAAKTHMSNPNLLLQIHKLLGFLAFVPETLRDIVSSWKYVHVLFLFVCLTNVFLFSSLPLFRFNTMAHA